MVQDKKVTFQKYVICYFFLDKKYEFGNPRPTVIFMIYLISLGWNDS
jgi:hypothetical protein